MKELGLALTSQGTTWFGVLVDSRDRLVASAFSEQRNAVENHLSSYSKRIAGAGTRHVKNIFVEEMSMLFNGEKPKHKVSLNQDSVTNFQSSVYRVLSAIPKGRVTTYGQIARKLKSGPRAVGNAVGSNPWPLFVPCHRVVPFNMTLGNYSTLEMHDRDGSGVKRTLLEREGVRFQGEKILATEIWNP